MNAAVAAVGMKGQIIKYGVVAVLIFGGMFFFFHTGILGQFGQMFGDITGMMANVTHAGTWGIGRGFGLWGHHSVLSGIL